MSPNKIAVNQPGISFSFFSFIGRIDDSKYIENDASKFVVTANFNSPTLVRVQPTDNRILHKRGELGETTIYGESLTFTSAGFS